MARRLACLFVGLLAACDESPAHVIDAAPGIDAADPADAATTDAGPGLPDLTVSLARARADLAVQERTFAPDDCELLEEDLCVGGPGERTLLHFAVLTPNVGDGDLLLGTPGSGNPNFVYSTCHEHPHFLGYAAYRLLDQMGDEVAFGRKQAFCLLDTERWDEEDPTVAATPRYHCEYQGIQRGWADVYHTRLPCQFVDVTGVAPGSYTLEIELNQDQSFAELDYANNLMTVSVELGAADLSTPTEECAADIDLSALEGAHRECGWSLGDTIACTPGATVDVGCSGACGLGSCTGDPMMRICDGARPDGNCSYPGALALSDDFGGQCPCELGVVCPESGELEVYVAPFTPGASYECILASDV